MIMQQFDISLKNPKIKSYRFIALFIVIVNFAFFIFFLITGFHFFESAAAVFLILLYCLYRFYLSKKFKIGFYLDDLSFFILAGCWVATQNYLVAFLSAIMGILYHLSLQKLQFIFAADFVKKVNFPPTEFQWSRFTNVMLRDNILTLDFRNNKLLQLEIEDEKKIDEKVFNEFAKERMNKYLLVQEDTLSD
jgi:hypothetical protein